MEATRFITIKSFLQCFSMRPFDVAIFQFVLVCFGV